MIISYTAHKKMQLQNAGLQTIATSSTLVWKDLILSFQNQSSFLNIYTDHYEGIEIQNAFDFIGDLFLTPGIDSKYLTIIIKYFIQDLDEENRNTILKTYQTLENSVQDALLLEDLPLEINFTEDIKKLLKLMEIHLDDKEMLIPYDKIKNIVKIHSFYAMKTIPVVCNLANYLNAQEVKELNKLLLQLKQALIVLEFKDQNFQVDSGDNNFFYIDSDLVDWY